MSLGKARRAFFMDEEPFHNDDISIVANGPSDASSMPGTSDAAGSSPIKGMANWPSQKRGHSSGHSSGIDSQQSPVMMNSGSFVADSDTGEGGKQRCGLDRSDPLPQPNVHDGDWSSSKKHSGDCNKKGERYGLAASSGQSQEDAGVDFASQEKWMSSRKQWPGRSAGHHNASRDEDDSYLSDKNQAGTSFSFKDSPPSSDVAATPLSIQVIFRPQNPSRSFWKVDYAKVKRELVKAAGCKLPSQKVLRSGFLSVIAPNPDAARRMLQLSSVADIAVDAILSKSYCRNVGKISGVPFRYTDKQLMECFAEDGVIHARRQVTYLRRKNGSVSTTPEDGIVLTFRPDIEMPDTIELGFDVFRVHTYCPPPTQCYRCLRFGHTSRQCNSPRRCKLCSGPHTYKECRNPKELVCANCGEEHTATFLGCPERRKAAMSRRFMPRYYNDPEDVSSRRSYSSERRSDRDDHDSTTSDSERSCSDGKESRRTKSGSSICERNSSKDKTRTSRRDRGRCRDRSNSRERSPRDASRSPRRREGTPSASDSEEYGSRRSSEETTDDDDAVATPARRFIPPPRERVRPRTVMKCSMMTRDSRRRYRHGFNRYLHKLEKHGVSVFADP
ncbi:hypothetical protein HPB50_002097 [Hyalomma asiaticum]|uniref:Uncharacterized protein n=1 Tax=Hyalomma asiaticum TaxID=266040 RepID=A0ACB7RKW3_HYAAI|nr:hypothetical protein HPB50_002097 [Hyalomma asiaticum]